jgi:hypothetical protein
MGWGQISSFQFISFSPPALQDPVEGVETLTRPGTDGQGYRLLGKRGIDQRITTVTDLNAVTEADTFLANYRALIGTHVTVTDAVGESYSTVFVKSVIKIRQQNTGLSTSGPNTSTPQALLTCAWVLQSNNV